MSTLVPPPLRTPIQAQNGAMHPVWERWFISLFDRVGNTQSFTMDEVETALAMSIAETRVEETDDSSAFDSIAARSGFAEQDESTPFEPIVRYRHNDLDGQQGGSLYERYHVTSAESSELARSDNVLSVSANTSLDDTHRTIFVTATGKTITLPAASAARIGKDWTVILATDGYTDIARNGSDTLTLPETSSTIRLDQKGTSVTLRCLTASSWGIA